MFADVHPVTGRRTYSTPAMNKAARAKALARGGQVLLADIAPGASSGAAPGSAGSSTTLDSALTFATGGEPSGAASAEAPPEGESRPSPLPAALCVLTGRGPGRAFLLPLGRASLRGFHAEVGLSELTAEPPGAGAGAGPASPGRALAPPRPAAWAAWRPKSLAGPSLAGLGAPRALDAPD